jgi:type II secretory pathway component PulF
MSTHDPSPLDYAVAAPRGRLFSWSVFLTGAILCWGLIAFCVLVVPHYRQIYRDFHLQLPAASQILLSLSDLVNDKFGWAFLLLLPFALAVVMRRLTLRGRWARLVILLFFFTLIIGSILALFIPMISLIEGISK